MEDRIIQKIQALLERAGHPETPEGERIACEDKADVLMTKYRIERAMLNFKRTDTVREITNREFEAVQGDFAGTLNYIMYSVFQHSGCRATQAWKKITVVGYEEDIFFGEMLWVNIHREFVTRMLPSWSTSRTFDHNVYLLKESGKSWMEIVYAENEALGVKSTLTAKSGSRLRTAYKRWAERIGAEVPKEQPRNPKLWRESFAQSFEASIYRRLREMKAKRTGEEQATEGAAVALIKDEDRIKAEFYRLFPDRDPENIKKRDAEYEAAEAARRAALTDAERVAEDRQRERDRARWARQSASWKPSPRDQRGWEAGHNAASSVDLANGENRVGDGKGRQISS